AVSRRRDKLLARPTGFEPASARSTIESFRHLSYSRACIKFWWVWKDSNPQYSKEPRGYGPVGQPVAPTHPHLAESARVERASPKGTSRFKRDRLATCRTSPTVMAKISTIELRRSHKRSISK